MTTGENHLKIWKLFLFINILISFCVGISVFILTSNPTYAIIVFVGYSTGYLLGYYISPDLDLVGITSEESRLMRDFKIIGVGVVMWFFPYAYLMRFVGLGKKGHRNFFSHSLVGTVIRHAWLFGIFECVYLYLEYPPSYLLYAVSGNILGMMFADTLHYFGDSKLYKFIENFRRN